MRQTKKGAMLEGVSLSFAVSIACVDAVVAVVVAALVDRFSSSHRNRVVFGHNSETKVHEAVEAVEEEFVVVAGGCNRVHVPDKGQRRRVLRG
jgi:type II secretory pathway component PulK